MYKFMRVILVVASIYMRNIYFSFFDTIDWLAFQLSDKIPLGCSDNLWAHFETEKKSDKAP